MIEYYTEIILSFMQETLPGSNGEEPPGEVGLVTYPAT